MYVMCKSKGFMRDNVSCGEENGQQKYWNPEERKCTVDKSPMCKLEDMENMVPPQPGEWIYLFNFSFTSYTPLQFNIYPHRTFQ